MKSKKMKRERSNGKLTKNRQEKLDSRIEQKKIRLRTFAVRSMKHTEKKNFVRGLSHCHSASVSGAV